MNSQLSHRLRTYAGHGLRLAAWAAVAWCVHVAHARHVARLAAVDLAAVPVEVVRKHLPEAAAIGGESPAVAGGREVIGVSGDRVGTILRTSPAGDAAVGFVALVAAFPVMPVLGVPAADGSARLAVAVGVSLVVWWVLGQMAAARVTRRAVAGWREWLREFAVIGSGLWLGAVGAVLLSALALGAL